MTFKPTEVIFAPTAECNLDCPHCENEKSPGTLSVHAGLKFLDSCRKIGVERVGFTGGEPFLALDFMAAITRHAVSRSFLFSRIMTNGVWHGSAEVLARSLRRLRDAGYDGSVCVSVDAFHKQNLERLGDFIKTAQDVWRRPDCVSIATVVRSREAATEQKLKRLAMVLTSRLVGFKGRHPRIEGPGLFIKILKISLSAVGRAEQAEPVRPKGRSSLPGRGVKDPWDGRWFEEDHCEGPGNLFFVEPSGDVRPCCGYAADSRMMKIGNIYKDSAAAILKRARANRFVATIFGSGLVKIRQKLERLGFRFPGKTGDHCYFCDYVVKKVPRPMLDRCLDAVKAAVLASSMIFSAISYSSAEDLTLMASKDSRRMTAGIVKRYPIPTWYHEGLFYDGESVWVVNGEKGKTWVVDASSGEVKREIEPATGFTEAITRDPSGAFFLTDWDEKKIYRISIENDKMVRGSFVSLAPAHPAGIVWNGKGFFVIAWTRGLLGTKFDIIEMDAGLNTIARIDIGKIHEPAHMAWDGKNLWITSWFSKTVYKVDPAKWEITGYFKSPVSKTTGITWDGRYLWLTGTHGDLFQLEVGE